MNDRDITERAEISAFAHLAHTLSRISVQRHQWALEAERQDKPDLSRRYADEAAQKRDDASWYLRKAMARKDAIHG